MRIALIGAGGQLGSALEPLLAEEHHHDVVPLGRDDLEVTAISQVESKLAHIEPDVVINAAAYNHVDRAEEEPAAAFAVNAFGPQNLARFCGRRGITLLHVSTDYVFGLERERSVPYAESDAPGPLSAYGTSKLAGEYFVRALCERHYIVRTCGLYGTSRSSGKGNFVKTILRLSDERDELSVVDDQVCTPTSAADLARAIAALIATRRYGLYHATNAGSTTWYGVAAEICRLAGRPTRVNPISTEQYAAKAKRPAYSVLDTRKLQAAIGWELSDWREALAKYLMLSVASRP